MLFIVFVFNSYAEINPIDSTTGPIKIQTLRKNTDGSEIIVLKSINTKTNNIILDTILVKDFLIFRKIIIEE